MAPARAQRRRRPAGTAGTAGAAAPARHGRSAAGRAGGPPKWCVAVPAAGRAPAALPPSQDVGGARQGKRSCAAVDVAAVHPPLLGARRRARGRRHRPTASASVGQGCCCCPGRAASHTGCPRPGSFAARPPGRRRVRLCWLTGRRRRSPRSEAGVGGGGVLGRAGGQSSWPPHEQRRPRDAWTNAPGRHTDPIMMLGEGGGGPVRSHSLYTVSGEVGRGRGGGGRRARLSSTSRGSVRVWPPSTPHSPRRPRARVLVFAVLRRPVPVTRRRAAADRPCRYRGGFAGVILCRRGRGVPGGAPPARALLSPPTRHSRSWA